MSGHSKWAQIKRKKALTDAKKGRLFSKLSKIIEVAAKNGGTDYKTNFSLKAAVEQARAVNMPAANIEKAIEKGGGDGEGPSSLEEVLYEAYGPGGVAILIIGVTDNKNRTVSEIKHILSQFGGRLAESGSVKWLFKEKGVVRVSRGDESSLARVEELAILNNAEDVQVGHVDFEIIVSLAGFEKLKKVFQEVGFDTKDSSVEWLAKNLATLGQEDNEKLEAILEALEENEDVLERFTNRG